MKYLVGVDEAGRGPLAGPVAVGVAVVPMGFDWSLLPGVGDSKQVKPKDRETIYQLAFDLQKQGFLNFAVVQSSAHIIDTKGIVPAIRQAMAKGFHKLELLPAECEVRLDGSLKAPEEFLNQTTIIKGDASEPIIGLASILAKVTRDRYMSQQARKTEFNPYLFDVHKGYGTKKHIEQIKKYGLSSIHRQSFCRNIQTKISLV